MSFESVFEQWLHGSNRGEEEEEDQEEREEQPKKAEGVHASEASAEEEMPQIQREAWREEDVKDMPVLQKIVDLPMQGGRKLRSPPPPPLQITLSLKDTHTEGRHGKHSKKDRSPHKDKSKTLKVQTVREKGSNSDQVSEELVSNKIVAEGRNHRQCHTKSALTELTDLSHSASPTAPRGFEVDLTESTDHHSQDAKDKSPHHSAGSKHFLGVEHSKIKSPVLSPGRDFPMEPDSTSEFVVGSAKWRRKRKEHEASRWEVSPQSEVSPRSTGGATTPGSGSGEVTVRIEENLTECDSTSMFMTSPSAISPASQGDIEERVCPVLTDHEDGASPAHCVCRCQSLPPPSDLMPRDHVPITTTSPSPPSLTSPHLALITMNGTVSSKSGSKSWCPLVSHKNSLDDDTAPDLEQMAPSLDLEAGPFVSENDSPPVLTLPEQEARGKQFGLEHPQQRDISAMANQQETPPSLTKYGPDIVQSGNLRERASLDTKDNEGPPVLSLPGQEASAKLTKKEVDVCDFAKNIDWQTAVAETVESPPSLTKYDGESKPGIIIKIRTKSVMPRQELAPEPEPPAEVPRVNKKRHNTVDSPEMISRLRKRPKSDGEGEKMALPGHAQRSQPQGHSEDCAARGRRQKAGKGNACHCCSRLSPRYKRARRNTVHLDGDFKSYTKHLSPSDRRFVLTSTKLFRLQTRTHDLVCTVFPRLASQLSQVAPGSCHFSKTIDDIIASLERSDLEETAMDCEDVCELLEKLTLEGHGQDECVPVFSPRVMLCSSPEHTLEEFQDKVCRLLQLLLPDLTVSLSHSLSQTSDELEMVLKRIIMANKGKAARKCRF